MAFNGRFLLNMAHLATRQGGNLCSLIEPTGMSIEELNNESCIVDDDTYNTLLESAIELSGDDLFGLHAGENLNLTAAGLVFQLAQTSDTIKQAIELCCEYANLGCSVLPLDLIEDVGGYKVTFTPNEIWKNKSEIAYKHTASGVIAFTIKEYNSLTRMKHHPIKVYLSWPKPENTEEYERVFGCPVLFGQAENAVFLTKEQVEERVITSNYDLLTVLITHASEKSARISHEQGFQAVVKQSILNLIKLEFPSIEDVSSHLNVSSRTLQRKLKEEGSTFKKLIDELKLDLATGYLKHPELSISEIAYQLNYADSSAFNRSFKRWTGQTPTEFRASLQ